MEFYFFGGYLSEEDEGKQIKILEDAGFSGVLFTYDNNQGDFFTRIARDIKKDQKIKYMVAIRPYTISPQYLSMIHQSIEEIDPNRLQINLISGHIKSHEKNFGGILGDVTDKSSHIDKSNYLIRYIHEFNNMKSRNTKFKMPDYYVSTSNEYVFDAVKTFEEKAIIQYREYKQGYWTEYDDYTGKNIGMKPGSSFEIIKNKTMISLNPILRKTKEEIDKLEKKNYTTDTDYFTYQEFEDWIKKVESDGVDQILLICFGPSDEKKYVFDFINKYKEKYKE